MQTNHCARVTIHVSLLVFSIIYYRSIDSCVHSTILWRVKDTKYLLEHKDSMRGEARVTAASRKEKATTSHA